MERPEFYRFNQGEKSLPFDVSEYANRLKHLRADMQANGGGRVRVHINA